MSEKKSTSVRRSYDSEFKKDVLKMVLSGRPVCEISTSLGIRENLIHQWKKRHNVSAAALVPPGSAVSLAEYELIKTRLKEVEQERDILKKALGIFSRGS